jgi:uncharacterized membrane protein YedE/YeeE
MNIDFQYFTPISALICGCLIGLAAALLMLLQGRIAGISGIIGGLIGGLFQVSQGDIAWRVAFIAGLIMAPVGYGLFNTLPPINISTNTTLLIISGLIVGFGTRYGSGCTSGHGVCGISRLSPRSLVATLVFMGAGFITVFIMRHLIQGS